MSNKEGFYGGLICALPYRNESHFSLFMRMINNPTCKISKISYSSLYGFIFKLEIDKPTDPNNESTVVPFLKLNKYDKSKYDPVYSIIIKMALIEKSEYTRGLRPYNPPNSTEHIDKDYTNLKNFEEEIETQSKIYKNTILSGEPICPSIISSACLDITVANKLIDKMTGVADDNAKSMLSYIKTSLNEHKDFLLGVIAMESIAEYVTVFNYLGLLVKLSSRKYIYLNLIFLILRLWYETGYIHCDLHTNNAMIKRGRYTGLIKDIKLIDFGEKRGTGVPMDTSYNNIMVMYGNITHEKIGEDINTIIRSEKEYSRHEYRELDSRIESLYHKINDKNKNQHLSELFNNFSERYFKNKKLQQNMIEYSECYHIIKLMRVNKDIDLLSGTKRLEVEEKEKKAVEERQKAEKERQKAEETRRAEDEKRRSEDEKKRRAEDEKRISEEEKKRKAEEEEKIKEKIEKEERNAMAYVRMMGQQFGGRYKKKTRNIKRRVNKSAKLYKSITRKNPKKMYQ